MSWLAKNTCFWPLSACTCLLLLAACSPSEPPPAAPAGKEMSLERLYSLPSILGTEPGAAVWSGDSRRVAYLWNRDGSNFRDVFISRVDSPEPDRVTQMPRPEIVEGAGDDIAALRRNVQAEQHPGVNDVFWHPDGQHLLFSFEEMTYLVVPGGEPQALGDELRGARRLTFSPGGEFLAFLKGGALWTARVNGTSLGSYRNLTPSTPSEVSVESFRWSPDGERIAFVEQDSRQVPTRLIPDYLTEETSVTQIKRPLPGEPSASRRLGVVAASGGSVRWIELGGNAMDPIFGYEWSPDGDQILVDRSDLYVKHRRILMADPGSGGARLAYEEQEPDNVMAFWQIAWTPTGEGFYFLSDRDDFYHVYHLAEAGGPPQAVTSGNWAVESFHVSAAAGAIYFVSNQPRPEERQIFRVGLEGGEPVRVSLLEGTHRPTYSPDGRHAAVHHSSDQRPPDLYLTDLQIEQGSEASERRMTDSPLPEFDEYHWVEPEYVTFPSRADGVTLHGRLLLPPNLDRSRKYPAILGSVYSNTQRNQWGGRNAHPVWGLDQVLLQKGFVLLTVNFRGSWGHGRDFRRQLKLDYGGIDVEDIHSGVEFLETLGFVDTERVGIWGSSYGGLLTAMSLFKKPGVYKAGFAGAPATNVWHATTGEMRVMGEPADHPEEYADSSAFTHVAGLEDHLMILHGMRDRIVLFKDSIRLLENLLLLDKGHLVDFVPVPNSRHGWDREGLYQTRFTFQKLVEHFERHLGEDVR